MGMFRAAWDWLTQSADGVPTLTLDASTETTPRPIDMIISQMLRGTGRVSRAEALTVPGVLRGRNLVVGSISSLPLRQLDADNKVVRLPLLEQIDPDVPNVVTIAQTVEDLLFESVSWWRITAFGADGYPTSARHLAPGTVTLQPPGGRTPAPLPSGDDPRGAVLYVDGQPVPWSEMISFESPNPPLLVAAGRVIRRAILLDQMSETYADNPRPLDYLTPIDGVTDMTDEEVDDWLYKWKARRKRHGTAWMEGVEYHTVDTPNPAEMQLVESQARASLDIANALGLDPEDLGISTTSRTYQNATDRRQDRINDTLSPYMRIIEQRLSMPDVTKRGYRVVFDLDDYLRADPKTRAEVNAIYLDKGVTDVDEVRAEENLPTRPAGARPAAVAPAGGNVVPMRPRVAAGADDDGFVTFDGDVDRALTLDFQPEQFGVDFEARTIEGIVVPYGRDKVALKNGRRWRFKPGALQYGEARRVKLLRDHDFGQPLGKLVYVEERPDGVFARYQVGRGPDGDRALAEAEDGVRDGFSVGVDIVEFEPDPDNPGVFLATRAVWRETSVLAVPAFPDAMVSRVAATADQGEIVVTDTPVEPTPAPAAPAPGGLDLTAFAAAYAALQNGGALAAHQVQQPVTPEPRPVVDPTRGGTVFVNEALPYRFDRGGNFLPTEHVFSADLHAMALAHDQYGTETEAGKRVMGLLRETFATTPTGNVTDLNPTIQRPDMYVDQRDYKTPLWNAISKGAPPDGVNPFRFPKYSASSGLVGDHTEGTEPTSGSYTATGQTVTPTALSGKASITREVWDMGGNPAVSGLIFNQMKRGYSEGLESAAATFLNTLTAATDVNLGTAATDAAVSSAWDAALADLQFIRGYDFSVFVLEKELYKKFAGARDSSNRPLYPIIAPMNANGTAAARFRTLDLSGVLGIPSWALASTAGSPNNSWLFDPSTVFGWATAPQRLEFPGTASAGGYAPVAMVDIAIWGYKAFANTDIAGVRQVIYDTV